MAQRGGEREREIKRSRSIGDELVTAPNGGISSYLIAHISEGRCLPARKLKQNVRWGWPNPSPPEGIAWVDCRFQPVGILILAIGGEI
jgi:hypothetical protein